MKYSEVIPKLEEKFPELTGRFSLKMLTSGGACRVYINLKQPEIITYVELRLYHDQVLLAQPKSFLKTNQYVSKYTEKQKTRKCFYEAKNIVNYINRELICRGKTKKLEKTPKYKDWVSLTQYGF